MLRIALITLNVIGFIVSITAFFSPFQQISMKSKKEVQLDAEISQQTQKYFESSASFKSQQTSNAGGSSTLEGLV